MLPRAVPTLKDERTMRAGMTDNDGAGSEPMGMALPLAASPLIKGAVVAGPAIGSASSGLQARSSVSHDAGSLRLRMKRQ